MSAVCIGIMSRLLLMKYFPQIRSGNENGNIYFERIFEKLLSPASVGCQLHINSRTSGVHGKEQRRDIVIEMYGILTTGF